MNVNFVHYQIKFCVLDQNLPLAHYEHKFFVYYPKIVTHPFETAGP